MPTYTLLALHALDAASKSISTFFSCTRLKIQHVSAILKRIKINSWLILCNCVVGNDCNVVLDKIIVGILFGRVLELQTGLGRARAAGIAIRQVNLSYLLHTIVLG